MNILKYPWKGSVMGKVLCASAVCTVLGAKVALACQPGVQAAQNYEGSAYDSYAYMTAVCEDIPPNTGYVNFQMNYSGGQPVLSYSATGANNGCFLTWSTDGGGANYGQSYIGQYPYVNAQQVSEGWYYAEICQQYDGTWYGVQAGPASGGYVGPATLQ